MACAVRGRPGARCGYTQRRLTRSACHRSRVRGETVRCSWRRWQPAALVQDGPRFQERELGTLVAGPAKHILPGHDHEDEDLLQQAGDEQQERERVGIEGDDPGLGQRDPAELEDRR
jgi:hypothetical protein